VEGEISHHPLNEEGWAEKGHSEHRGEELCINEANLSADQNGSGTPGWGGAFYMSHQNATKPSSPSGMSQRVTLGQVCLCVYAHM